MAKKKTSTKKKSTAKKAPEPIARGSLSRRGTQAQWSFDGSEIVMRLNRPVGALPLVLAVEGECDAVDIRRPGHPDSVARPDEGSDDRRPTFRFRIPGPINPDDPIIFSPRSEVSDVQLGWT